MIKYTNLPESWATATLSEIANTHELRNEMWKAKRTALRDSMQR